MQFSETPFLLASKSIIDPSTFDDSYKQGQAIRQAYDARLHQKAMNEIMRLPDFKTQMTAAQSSKYAGALVPMVQAYEDERQKTALNNLKSSAEIGKIFGETGKLTAETGKLDTESQTKIYSELIPALSGSPHTFLQNIGEMGKKGLLSQTQVEQYGKIMLLPTSQQVQAFGAIIKSNPEMAKILLPQLKDMDLGGTKQLYSYDPYSGEVGDGGSYNVTISPDAQLQADTQVKTTSMNNTTSLGVAGINATSAQTVANINQAGANYRTEAEIKAEKAKGEVKEVGGMVYRVYSDGSYDVLGKAQPKPTTTTVGAASKPMPIGAVKEVNESQTNLQGIAKNLRNIANWIGKIESGQMQFGALDNFGNAAANKLGINALGSNPQQYAEYKAFTTAIASELLRLNKGVQTDMDYKRQLEALQAGDYIPRDNKTAIALLQRMMSDYDTAARAEYNNARATLGNYGRGESLGGYPSTSPVTTQQKTTPTQNAVADLWQ